MYCVYQVSVSSDNIIYEVMYVRGFKTLYIIAKFKKLYKFFEQAHFEVSLTFITKLQLTILFFIALPLLFILFIFKIISKFWKRKLCNETVCIQIFQLIYKKYTNKACSDVGVIPYRRGQHYPRGYTMFPAMDSEVNYSLAEVCIWHNVSRHFSQSKIDTYQSGISVMLYPTELHTNTTR